MQPTRLRCRRRPLRWGRRSSRPAVAIARRVAQLAGGLASVALRSAHGVQADAATIFQTPRGEAGGEVRSGKGPQDDIGPLAQRVAAAGVDFGGLKRGQHRAGPKASTQTDSKSGRSPDSRRTRDATRARSAAVASCSRASRLTRFVEGSPRMGSLLSKPGQTHNIKPRICLPFFVPNPQPLAPNPHLSARSGLRYSTSASHCRLPGSSAVRSKCHSACVGTSDSS